MSRCIPLCKAREAVCHPRPESPLCPLLLEALEESGVEAVCNYGEYRLPSGFRILGSGWAGNVIALVWRGMLVAGKILKPGSRRRSMLREALLAMMAGDYGIGPKVYRVHRYYILMRLVRGPRLAAYRASESWRRRLVVRRLIYKAYLLDRLGIDHGELVRPGGQVLVEDDEPYIVDYDSASARRRPRNLTRIVVGLWQLGLIERPPSEIQDLLHAYRLNPNARLVEEILEELKV